MRLLLALDVNSFEPDLKKLRINLNKAKNMEHRWIPSEYWHIPLCQLGEMGQEKLQQIYPVINSAVKVTSSFDLKLRGLWAYPSQEHGRLLWIGVQNSKELRELQIALVNGLSLESADYRPYLPIVRLKNFRELSDLLSPFKNSEFGKIRIDQVSVYEMMSGGAFPIYRRIKSFKLSELETHDLHL